MFIIKCQLIFFSSFILLLFYCLCMCFFSVILLLCLFARSVFQSFLGSVDASAFAVCTISIAILHSESCVPAVAFSRSVLYGAIIARIGIKKREWLFRLCIMCAWCVSLYLVFISWLVSVWWCVCVCGLNLELFTLWWCGNISAKKTKNHLQCRNYCGITRYQMKTKARQKYCAASQWNDGNCNN